MPDKKRYIKTDKKTDMLKKSPARMRSPETFDDVLEMQMNETIASVVKAEIYPSGVPFEKGNEPEEYRQPKSGGRFFQDPYTVALHYIDRVQFRR